MRLFPVRAHAYLGQQRHAQVGHAGHQAAGESGEYQLNRRRRVVLGSEDAGVIGLDGESLVARLLGPEAELESPWSKAWQFSLSGPIYAGTNEIQRNVVAERVLGLDRKSVV